MVKFNSLRKALSKKLAPKDDDAAVIATQAAKDAQFQLQMQQYQQWQMQQQAQQAALVAQQNSVVNEEAVDAAPHESGPIDADMTQSESIEESRNHDEAPAEEASVDDTCENRDDEEQTALANTTTEEEESVVSETEEEPSVGTTDDEGTRMMSYDEETYDGNDEVKDVKSYDGSLAACEAMGNQKKFFHKDVVLHNLNEHNAGNDLVIRAMYFVPKPKSPDDVVVRIEVSCL